MASFSVSADDPRVLLDQVRAAAGPPTEKVPSTVLANMLAAGLMVFAMWGQIPPNMLWGWLTAMLGYQLLRVGVSRRFWHQHTTDVQQLLRWLKRFNALAIGSGLMWGMTGVVMYASDSVIHQAMLAILLCAMAAGSIAANAVLKVGMPGSASVVLLLLMGRMAWEDDRAHWSMVMMLMVYWVFVLKWGQELHAVVIESLQRRHQNHDLVEQLQLQTEAALDAQHKAEQANQSKSKFLAAASHDLRQPMAALSLFAGVMTREKRPEQLHKLAEHVGTSVSALESLFNGLLDVSKLDAGVTQVQLKDFDLQPLLVRLINDFTPEAQQKRLTLAIPVSPARLHSDPRLLEQVLRNLVSNAIRYTALGQVAVQAEPLSSGWRLAVIDTGIGIAPEHQEKVFDEFFQVGNAERDRSKGLGLGLSIVKRLSRLLNLHLELQSAPGTGTTLYLHVPAAQMPQAPTTASPPVERRERLPGLRVLMVDDEAPIRQAMELLLKLWQCDVRIYESLDTLVEMAATQAPATWVPDLLISDYRLQNGVYGTAVLGWAHAHWNTHIPALLLTGDTAPASLRHIEESGHRMVHKPVDPAQLHATILELLPASAKANRLS